MGLPASSLRKTAVISYSMRRPSVEVAVRAFLAVCQVGRLEIGSPLDRLEQMLPRQCLLHMARHFASRSSSFRSPEH